MRIALTMLGDGDLDVVEAQIAFHLGVGVDEILVGVDPAGAAARMVAGYASGGTVRAVAPGRPRNDTLGQLRRLVVEDGRADWLLECRRGEFWWPRAETLADVLAPVPGRYTVVQGLVRELVGESGDEPFYERSTLRRQRAQGASPESLRPVYRLRPGGATSEIEDVPLRAWYPIEVMHVAPGHTSDATADAPDFVVDERLRDALRALRAAAGPDARDCRYALASELVTPLVARPPTAADDARYAIECAAVGEVDLVTFSKHLTSLEGRIAELERRLWPTIRRRVARLVRR